MKIASALPFVVLACGRAAAPAVIVPEQVVVADPPPAATVAEAEPEPATRVVVPDEVEDDTPGAFTGAWSVTFNHVNKYAVARQNMQVARTSYLNATTPLTAGTVPAPRDFEKANAALDALNRLYAAVYYAPDATDEQRVATLDEAANTLLDWANHLAAIGLDKLPKSFNANGSIALTFEDVLHGPAKRWRGEGMSLANACIARAKANNVTSTAATHCSDLIKKHADLPTPPHAKTKPECACVPGDPLCSATMSGWCKPK